MQKEDEPEKKKEPGGENSETDLESEMLELRRRQRRVKKN